MFESSNPKDMELPADLFSEFKFKKIVVKNSNFSLVHENSFTDTSLSLEELVLENNGLANAFPHEESLFVALSKLFSLKRLSLRNNKLSLIPANAFRKIVLTQGKLKDLDLSDNQISDVGDFAFNELVNVQSISLAGNRLTHVRRNAFTFLKASPIPLTIDLRNNRLKSDAFDVRALDIIRRGEVHLVLNNNGIQYLDQRVFGSYLESPATSLQAEGNPLTCSCELKWLWVQRMDYKGKVQGDLTCADGRDFFTELSDRHFRFCPQDMFFSPIVSLRRRAIASK